jgi:branched-chain amino acid transport system permease protein
MGAAFVVMLPRVVQNFTEWLKAAIDQGGFIAVIADPIVATSATDRGIINTLPGVGPGLSVLQANQVLYGLLIIGFLIFEPLGLYGIWLRIRNYWKGWPFTY